MDLVRDFWAIIAAAVAVIVWFIRLESRGIANAADIKRLWNQRKEDLEAAKDSRDRVDRRLDEISADIKTILRGMAK
jgi:hypothetical protein